MIIEQMGQHHCYRLRQVYCISYIVIFVLEVGVGAKQKLDMIFSVKNVNMVWVKIFEQTVILYIRGAPSCCY